MLTLAPFGLKPNFHTSGNANPRVQIGFVNSAPSASLYLNIPVKQSGGIIVPVAAATDVILGSFAGLQYIDQTGAVKERPYVLAGTPFFATGGSYNNGDPYTNIGTPYVYQDPDMEYIIQATGTMPKTSVGQTYNISMTNIAAANTIGTSTVALNNAVVVDGTGTLIVTGLWQTPGNVWGDTYTIVKVKRNNIL